MAFASPWRRTPITKLSSVHSMATVQRCAADVCSRRPAASIGREVQTHFAIALRIVAPPFAHLDEQHEVHPRLDDRSDFLPRLRADRLDRLAAAAEHDLALAFALD